MKIAADQVMNGRDSGILRGDPIIGDRYTCADFAAKEWKYLWKKIWHGAGRESELQDRGGFHSTQLYERVGVRCEAGGRQLESFFQCMWASWPALGKRQFARDRWISLSLSWMVMGN